MRKKYYKATISLIALLVIPIAVYQYEGFQSNELLATSSGTPKTAIEQYEKIKMGNKILTKLDATSFLSDDAIGSALTWSNAQTTANNWSTSSDFSDKEKQYITSTQMASKADLPITTDTLDTAIKRTANWWLSDEQTGEGNPRSFVNDSNKVDAGYDRIVANNTSDTVCGTKTEHKEGGLNTIAYTGPGTQGFQVPEWTVTNTGTTSTHTSITNTKNVGNILPGRQRFNGFTNFPIGATQVMTRLFISKCGYNSEYII